MATMNVSLPGLMKEWVGDQIKTGHFSNASDYVRDLICRDQAYHDRREMQIKALIAGENSGESERSIEDIWRGVKAGGRHSADRRHDRQTQDADHPDATRRSGR